MNNVIIKRHYNYGKLPLLKYPNDEGNINIELQQSYYFLNMDREW